MSEKSAFSLNVAELDLKRWSFTKFMTGANETIDIEKSYRELPETEIYAARDVAAMFKDRVTYAEGEHKWHIWDGRIHLPCEGSGVALDMIDFYYDQLSLALQRVKAEYSLQVEILKCTGQVDGENLENEIKKIMKPYFDKFSNHRNLRDRLATNAGRQAVLALLESIMRVPSDHFDDDRRWFVLRNCVIDAVETAERGEIVWKHHDPSRPVWRFFDASYDPEAASPALMRFVNNSLADETQGAFLAQTLGAALVGAPVKMKTVVDAYGETNSGKSMLNSVLETLCGDYYAEATEPAVAANSKEGDRYRDTLRVARVVTTLEVKKKLDKGFILKYTGGDTIETTAKYRNNIKWKPQGVIIMLSNEGMNIGAQEPAVADRIERINFPHRFELDSADERYKMDPELQNKILGERDGFVTWLLNGYLAYCSNNIDGKPVPSESMAFLKAQMQDEGNSFAIFWDKNKDTRYEVNASAPNYKKVEWTSCYANYKQWCKETSHDLMDEADAKNWAKQEGVTDRIGGRLRLVDRVENLSISALLRS